ncbi:DUF86 domain-containing protein [Runella sp. MFBS21]|uniref:HepT-like ribonuclease domain-containing protein n=1 Tax=Runella sp. MFBS21 TaxID=3034018 RepID=UPI0023F837E4|nr:HepT-like ribonuclease domain-containing protein [Runella sp. MFBS21]MDF7821905.1 DUF86 domain-containing protein [Runella sp. MFBS21]
MSENRNRDLLPLLVILESIGKISVYSKDFHNAQDFFMADDQVRFNASLLLLSNIGEYVGKISDEIKTKYSSIPWRQVRGLRNRIAHDYTGIDYEMVFDVVSNDLPTFKTALEAILKEGFAADLFDINECQAAQNSIFYKHVNFEFFI